MGTVTGFLIVLLGGVLEGAWTGPNAFVQGWEWENVWLVYSVVAMILLPWGTALATVPHLFAAFTDATASSVACALSFGFLWGIGTVLFGLADKMVGQALTFSLVIGLVASVGTLVPLFVLNSDEVVSAKGGVIILGVIIILVGLCVAGYAGTLKGRHSNSTSPREEGDPTVKSFSSSSSPLSEPSSTPLSSVMRKGLLVCLVSGITASFSNLGLVFGEDVADSAEDHGAHKEFAPTATWSLVMSMHFLPNLVYSTYLLTKNGTWKVYVDTKKSESMEFSRNIVIAISMAALWYYGMAVMAAGGSMLGDLGDSFGWALFSAMMIMTANVIGILKGEWRGTGSKPLRTMFVSLGILLGAIGVIGYGLSL